MNRTVGSGKEKSSIGPGMRNKQGPEEFHHGRYLLCDIDYILIDFGESCNLLIIIPVAGADAASLIRGQRRVALGAFVGLVVAIRSEC